MDILSRWIHISAAAITVGGLVYAYFILLPSIRNLPDEHYKMLLRKTAERFRPISLISIVLLIVSGMYNLLRILENGVDKHYHMIFGFKFLIAAHVFAMLYITSRPLSDGDTIKKKRLLLGGVVSGLVVLALGAYLRILRS